MDSDAQQLCTTYKRSLEFDITELRRLVEAVADRDVAFVGSGGALAVAQLAADLHRELTGKPGLATTPLDLLSTVGGGTQIVIISARARHPDVRLATEIGRRLDCRSVLVTLKKIDDIAPALARLTDVVSLHNGWVGDDGFLATNSVLALGTLLARAYAEGTNPLPRSLPGLTRRVEAHFSERTLVLWGPGYRAVATDIETRFAETGLSSTEMADYRNFAHGRHLGLVRNLDRTHVIMLRAPQYAVLADATGALVPPEVSRTWLSTELGWPAGVLDLIASTTRLVNQLANSSDINLRRPGVKPFGRKLYNMPALSKVSLPQPTPVLRKLRELSARRSVEIVRVYESALNSWLNELADITFNAVVLDYDGTVCETSQRFHPPSAPIQRELLRLLSAGLVVGFASGRGLSLHRDLRSWVPAAHWEQIHLTLYGGGATMRLKETRLPKRSPVAELAWLSKTIQREVGDAVRVELRARHLQISPLTSFSISALHQLVTEIAGRENAFNLRVAMSGHSVDVTHRDDSKALLVEALSQSGSALAIGDQGQLSGNDFDLLARTRWSLSVDRTSADPSRCWHLGDTPIKGPRRLREYLRALRVRRGEARYYPG